MVIYSYEGDDMDKNYLVTKSNYFIMNSSYDLSLEEQKLILTLASMVQPSDEEFKPYKFKISEFIELLGVENQAKYTETPKITKELMKKVFEIQEGNKLIQTAWLSSAMYEKGTGYVELTFSPYLKPYMLKLSSMFTQYKLANILSMKSKYSPRIYEILKCNEFKKQGYIEIEVKELRKLLKADNIYPLYADFKRRVLQQAQKELKKLSDISFEFEEIKTGRTITAIRFYINANSNKFIDQIAVTTSSEPQQIQQSFDDIANIKKVQAIFNKHKVTNNEASCILKDADNNLDLIKQCYDYLLTKDKVENVVGYMRKLVKGFNEPQSNKKQSAWDYDGQRTYDFDELERKIFGWESN